MYLNKTTATINEGSSDRLTLTWDVFKLIIKIIIFNGILWLTLTWDVFK